MDFGTHGEELVVGRDGAGLEFDEFVLGDAAGTEDGDLG
jgi:hypothetical protein